MVASDQCRDDVDDHPSTDNELSVLPTDRGIQQSQKVIAFVLKKGKSFKKILTLKTSDLDEQELIQLILKELHQKKSTRFPKEDESRDMYNRSHDISKYDSMRSFEGQRCDMMEGSTPICGESTGSHKTSRRARLQQDHQVQSKCFDSSATSPKMSANSGEEEDMNELVYGNCGGAKLENIGSFPKRSQGGEYNADVITAPTPNQTAVYTESATSMLHNDVVTDDDECNRSKKEHERAYYNGYRISQDENIDILKKDSTVSLKKYIQQEDTFDENEVKDSNCYDHFDISRMRRSLTANYLPTERSAKCDDTLFVEAIVDATFLLSDFCFFEERSDPKETHTT